jgi:hypothetical protein
MNSSFIFNSLNFKFSFNFILSLFKLSIYFFKLLFFFRSPFIKLLLLFIVILLINYFSFIFFNIERSRNLNSSILNKSLFFNVLMIDWRYRQRQSLFTIGLSILNFLMLSIFLVPSRLRFIFYSTRLLISLSILCTSKFFFKINLSLS